MVFAGSLPEADQAIAAIGLTFPFEFLFIACWVGASNGLTARLSAALGANEGEKIEQLKRATLRIVAALSALFAVLAVALWFGADLYAPAEIVEPFRIYATVLMGGSALTAYWSIVPDSVVKMHHDTRATMWAGLASSIVNVVLNATFVFVFGWGIFGIALSTVLGRLAGLAYAIARARQHERARIASGTCDRPGRFERPVRAILVLAVPSGITYVLLAIEGVWVNKILGARADCLSVLPAWTIFDQTTRFLSMPMIATGVAMLPLAARLHGRGDVLGIRRELRTGLLFGLGYVVALVPLLLLFGASLGAALAETEASQAATRAAMRWVPLAVLALSPLFLLRSTFDGMQMPRPGLVVSLIRSLVLVVPLVVLGLEVAPSIGVEPVVGAVLGFGLGAGVASGLLLLWLVRVLRERDTAGAAPG